MLRVGSALMGYTIAATDGHIGSVSDMMFDDRRWTLRWLVVDTGRWLSGRKVLLHPSALRQPDGAMETLPVALTKQQISDSPEFHHELPVSREIEQRLHTHFGWDPFWGSSLYGAMAMSEEKRPHPQPGDDEPERVAEEVSEHEPSFDPHLQSFTGMNGYHIEAEDGGIGHVENLLLDDENWTIRYLIVDTRNWWQGKRVLIAPHAVTAIRATEERISVDLTQAAVRSSPEWNPLKTVDEEYAARLHRHYGWPARVP